MELKRSLRRFVNFERNYGVKVKTCGLVVSVKWPHLGYSPDGVVEGDQHELVEIKCPYSSKNSSVLNDSGVPQVNYLKMIDGNVTLCKKNVGIST